MRQPLAILFVCTGNMCRSPLAERLARAWLLRAAINGIEVSSAGTHAVVGARIHPDTAVVLQRLGGDPEGFSGRQLTRQMADDAGLILTAARSHCETVAALCPAAVARTFTLRELAALTAAVPAGDICAMADAAARARALTAAAVPLRELLAAWPADRLDIPDPVGRSMAMQEATASAIADALAGPLALIAGLPGLIGLIAGQPGSGTPVS